MRRSYPAVVLLAAVCWIFPNSNAVGSDDTPPSRQAAELQGCWKLVSLEVNGETRKPLGGGEVRWVVKGDQVFYGGVEAIRISADPSTTPRVIDLKFLEPDEAYEGIYAIEKDQLKVCFNARSDQKERPGKFSTEGQSDWRLLVFEREKSAPANPTEGLTAFAGVAIRKHPESDQIEVDSAIKGSPAEKAGLKKGDVILRVGSTQATELEGTVNAVREAKPGSKLLFTIRRDGKEMMVTVTVGVLPLQFIVLMG